MRLYLDSSAIVKLVAREPESAALRRFLRRHAADERVTSTLARVEVVRAVGPNGPRAIGHARRQLRRLHQVQIHDQVLDRAEALASATVLRSLDAIHVASAQLLGTELRSVITYDRRMTDACAAVGLPTQAPA